MTAKRDVWFALTFLPLTTGEIAKASGLTLEAARRYLDELLREGFVVRQGVAIQPIWHIAARGRQSSLDLLESLDREVFNDPNAPAKPPF